MKSSLLTFLCKAFGLCVLLLHAIAVFAQPKVNWGFPSPNATSFGIFGQIPVNYANGLASISVPLHTIEERGISMPLELSYHASGVRADHHPGWVGLNWNLSAGGVITRIVNGDADEMKVPNNMAGVGNNYAKSYLTNYGGLNRSDWDQPSAFLPIVQNYKVFNSSTSAMPSPDEFTFNFNGYSGSSFSTTLAIGG